MSAGWMSRLALSGVAAAALAATAFAVAANSHAQAPKYPEYHKTWEDGALRKPLKKGLKANTSRNKGRPNAAHVGISLGDGTTIESKKKLPKSNALCAPPGGGKPRAC
jgi:hypothetical protein